VETWFFKAAFAVVLVLSGTALFFFTLTRGALLVRGLLGGEKKPDSHVYPIYSNMKLIRLIDFQPIISAILLFQYHRLVSVITDSLVKENLKGKDTLITSCAFGNVIPRVVEAAAEAGTRQVWIADIIQNELDHANHKLPSYAGKLKFLHEDVASLSLPDASVSANVLFFLLHELPNPVKAVVLNEAVRVLQPGGKLYIGEFHKPSNWVLKVLSWTYFKVFEPYGLALWNSHDPIQQLQGLGFECERRTMFFDNFQMIVATKPQA
jgi:ubiquinone/menaquinone biosynthesis C-methylase UbiE